MIQRALPELQEPSAAADCRQSPPFCSDRAMQARSRGDGCVRERLTAAGALPIGPAALAALRAASGLADYAQHRPLASEILPHSGPLRFELRKPYFVGQQSLAAFRQKPDLPVFAWQEPQDAALKRTPLYEWHRAHTRHIVPFAGWEMPVWYTGVLDEHNAVRRAAGLFDVSHMGVFEASGPHAEEFLDLVLTNYVRWYATGELLRLPPRPGRQRDRRPARLSPRGGPDSRSWSTRRTQTRTGRG